MHQQYPPNSATEVIAMEPIKVEARQETRQAYQAPKLDYQGQWETVVGYSNDCKQVICD
jgi:hypothetical protein